MEAEVISNDHLYESLVESRRLTRSDLVTRTQGGCSGRAVGEGVAVKELMGDPSWERPTGPGRQWGSSVSERLRVSCED
jgi:hypothetical protein